MNRPIPAVFQTGLVALVLVTASATQATAEGLHTRHEQAIAEVEIARLPIAYAWPVDTKDIDLLMAVFSEDIVYDLSAYAFPSATGKTEGQHFYEFRKESGAWRISRMSGSPFFGKWETYDRAGLLCCK